MKPILLLTVLLALFSQLANGQVKTNFNNAEVMTARGKFGKNFQAKSPRTIPAKDIKSLLEREAMESKSGEAKPLKIAEAVKVDIDAVKEAAWVEEGGFAHGKYTIIANGAKSISANFDRFKLPKGTELYVYSANGEMITGPITENENNENNFWGTWVYKGGSLTVDFKTPVKTKSELKLHISSVAYGYKDIYRSEVNNFGESSPCNINVLCPLGNGWENERNSVALILDANSTRLCSGALINNTCNLNIPYLLTANHCFEGDPLQNVTQWKFTFQAWSPICDRLQQQNANGVTFNGSTLRARNANSDFCLVELTQLPPANSGITFSGWSRNTVGIQSTTIIHHPAGDVMKISRDDQAPVFATFLGSQEWQLVLDQGATNGGSSGAPYYDQNHRIIAQHHGINQNNVDQCLNTNKFGGRFDISWTGGGSNTTRLSNWLDPQNTGALTTNTISIANTIPNPATTSISGPPIICTSGTFTFSPATPLVTWSSSNPSGLSINASGVATRLNGFSGSFTITATINGGTCGNFVVSKQVYVGVPFQPTDYPITSGGVGTGITIRRGQTITLVAPVLPTANIYEWTKLTSTSGATQIVKTGASNQYTYTAGVGVINNGPNLTSDIIFLRVGNPCQLPAQAQPQVFTIMINSSGLLSVRLSTFPNPATSTLTVQVTDSLSINPGSNQLDEVYQLQLTYRFSRKVFSTEPSEASIQIPTEGLAPDIYYLNVFYKDAVLRKQIVIKR